MMTRLLPLLLIGVAGCNLQRQPPIAAAKMTDTEELNFALRRMPPEHEAAFAKVNSKPLPTAPAAKPKPAQ